MSKFGQRTTTFPVDWDSIVKLESLLLRSFLETKDDRVGIDLMMICIGSRFGLRVSDLLKLKWNQLIEIKPGQSLTLVEKKTKKIRQITVTQKVKSMIDQLTQHLNIDQQGYIFTSQKSKGEPMTIQNFNIRLKKIFTDNKIKTNNNISSHLLRKSFVVRSIKSGLEKGDHLSLIKVSHLINHSSVNQTIRYCNYETETLQSLYNLD